MTELIITFRETLEASLIVGIVLAYLAQTQRRKYFPVIFIATGLAVIASAALAVVFNQFLGGFTGRNEELFEGVAMVVAAILVSTVVLWMMRQRQGVKQLQEKVDRHLSLGQEVGLFGLVFLSVMREGVETVLFLSAKSLDGGGNLAMAALGVVLAVGLGFLIFKVGVRVSLKPFFLISSLFLVMFGAGLFAHGVHELEEAGLVNPVMEHVWDINGVVNEKRGVGSLAKDLFGYNGNPSLVEVGAYLAYLNVIYIYYLYTNQKKD